MIETSNDPRLYGRAVDKTLSKARSMDLDESMAQFMRRVALDAIMAFEDEIDRIRKEGK